MNFMDMKIGGLSLIFLNYQSSIAAAEIGGWLFVGYYLLMIIIALRKEFKESKFSWKKFFNCLKVWKIKK